MHTDGDGWTTCGQGHRHWGLHGGAGLLVSALQDGVPVVLLQHRAAWTTDGDTWGIPGGARDSHEDAVAAALREAAEEAGLRPEDVLPREVSRDDHGGWAYDTVLTVAATALATAANAESVELRWVPVDEVAALRLHPGFAGTWPQHRARVLALLAGPVEAD